MFVFSFFCEGNSLYLLKWTFLQQEGLIQISEVAFLIDVPEKTLDFFTSIYLSHMFLIR